MFSIGCITVSNWNRYIMLVLSHYKPYKNMLGLNKEQKKKNFLQKFAHTNFRCRLFVSKNIFMLKRLRYIFPFNVIIPRNMLSIYVWSQKLKNPWWTLLIYHFSKGFLKSCSLKSFWDCKNDIKSRLSYNNTEKHVKMGDMKKWEF